ncbi:putative ferric-chelate reductase 1 [Watersipora subatra]|uniref:putative ferric-chelate reductase 1 n=1 Tax=Watersipora subatra TaxID=2589382 RepID=UPI00355B520F
MNKATIFIALFSISCCDSHSDGSISPACNDFEMKPRHGGEVSRKNEGAFEVRIQSQEYDPLNPSTVSVKIISSTGVRFKGFLIQARRHNSFDAIAKGIMNGPASLTRQICGNEGNGMAHTAEFSNNWKDEISLNWSPYEDVCDNLDMGDLQFQLTVVRSFSEKAQVNIFSSVLKMKNVTDLDLIRQCENRVRSVGGVVSVPLFLIVGLFVLQLL